MQHKIQVNLQVVLSIILLKDWADQRVNVGSSLEGSHLVQKAEG